MSLANKAYLLVEKGNPHTCGDLIPLEKTTVTIGRQSPTDEPDISFSNPVISRNHLRIEWKDKAYYVVDQNSRNRTNINGKNIDKSIHYKLSNGDRLSLANDAAVLLFFYTMGTTTLPLSQISEQPDIRFDPERRELFVEGRKIVLQGNYYELFAVLYENRGKVISHSEIKLAVWPRRAKDKDGVPLATEQEIHLLVMRLREKLGSYSRFLINARGHGYLLDLK